MILKKIICKRHLHAWIQRGDRGSRPPPPCKVTSYMGFCRNSHFKPCKKWTPWKMLDPSKTLENYSFL